MRFCSILRSQSEIDESKQRLLARGFEPNAGCPPKDWDLARTLPDLHDGNLLDMGCQGSPVLANAARFTGDKVGIDLVPVPAPPGCRTVVGDLMDTGLPDGHFDAITCLSTIEHGVDVPRFLTEAARLLAPGGRLYITFDYAEPKIHTGITMFGLPWNIFGRADVEALIVEAARHGLAPVEPMDFTMQDRPLPYGSFSYTFGMVVFEKAPGVDVLVVNNAHETCGVYQFGKRLVQNLRRPDARATAKGFNFRRVDCADASDLRRAVEARWPALVVFNYMPSTLPWVDQALVDSLGVPTAGIYHDIAQVIADDLQPAPFKHWLAPDPTLRPTAHCTPFTRPLASWMPTRPWTLGATFNVPTVGTFGFGSYCKGHVKLIELASQSWQRSRVRIHMPLTHADPREGSVPHQVADQARAAAARVGNVDLEITHDFLSDAKLLEWLADNTINVFLYEESGQPRGISSAPDYALAVPRPIAITRCSMFRHIWDAKPSICVEDSTLLQIATRGLESLQPFRRDFTPGRIAAAFADVLERLT